MTLTITDQYAIIRLPDEKTGRGANKDHQEVIEMISNYDMHRFGSFFEADPFMKSLFYAGGNREPGYHRCHVREEEDSYVLEIALPGVSADRINVSVRNDQMRITVSMDEEKQNGHGCMRHGMSMDCVWSLEGIDQERITAESRYGMLYVTLPKEKAGEEAEERKIPVKCEEKMLSEETIKEA